MNWRKPDWKSCRHLGHWTNATLSILTMSSFDALKNIWKRIMIHELLKVIYPIRFSSWIHFTIYEETLGYLYIYINCHYNIMWYPSLNFFHRHTTELEVFHHHVNMYAPKQHSYRSVLCAYFYQDGKVCHVVKTWPWYGTIGWLF